LEVGIQDVSCC